MDMPLLSTFEWSLGTSLNGHLLSKNTDRLKYVDLDFNSEQIILSRKHYEKDENQQKQIITFMLCWIHCHHFNNRLYPSCNQINANLLKSSRNPNQRNSSFSAFQNSLHNTLLFIFIVTSPQSLFQPCPVNTVGYLLWTPECWQYFHFIVAGQDNKYRFIIKCPTFHTMQICPACSLLLAVLFPKGPLGRGYQPD